MAVSQLALQICQVIEPESDHTLYDKYQDEDGLDHPPGTIRIRLRGKEMTTSSEVWAVPSDPTMLNVPLYGEQVLVYNAIDGKAEKLNQYRWYYMCLVNAHGIVNNTIMPFIQDSQVSGRGYSSDGISKVSPGAEPKQVSFEKKDVLPIQPFQGDTIRASRFGSILRFSSTHLELDKYKEEPFWEGEKAGDPFIAITCEVKGLLDGYSGEDTYDPYYKIEEPDDDKSFIYLTSKQKIKRFELAQPNIGQTPEEPMPLVDYQESQVIIGSERMIFNTRKDEMILVSAKDIKFVTPAWQIDADHYFTQIEEWLKVCVDLAEGIERYATPSGPTGQSSALERLKEIQEEIEKMHQ
jgi:hypothetical protein